MLFDAIRALALLSAANAVPVIVAQLVRERWSTPLDFGYVMPDGERLFGSHKTWRGLVSGILAGAAVGALFELSLHARSGPDRGEVAGHNAREDIMSLRKAIAAIVASTSMMLSAVAAAHCDGMDGPVVRDARIALEERDLTVVLKWVSPDRK